MLIDHFCLTFAGGAWLIASYPVGRALTPIFLIDLPILKCVKLSLKQQSLPFFRTSFASG